MSNYMEAVFEPVERAYKRTIIHQTWGHLAPTPEEVYRGIILFTHGCCGDITVIDYRFIDKAGKELDSSPWLWEDITRYVGNLVLPEKAYKSVLPKGRIYRFEGRYVKEPDSPDPNSNLMQEGEGRFVGKLKRIKIQIKKKGRRP